MKKIISVLFLFLFTVTCALADYRSYYEFESNLDVKFIPYEGELSKDLKKEYKKIKKNEKYIKQGKYEKAEKLMPDYIPNIARFINAYTVKKDYPRALEYAKKLLELDKTNLFPKSSKDYRLGVLYSMNGDYINSNKCLLPYVNTNSMARFQIAQNYYYMQDLKTAESYASKIRKSEGAFFPAQELLYTIYSVLKNPQKAYTAAKNLVELDPGNPQNYMRVASSTSNNAEKLRYYYRAKQIYYTQNLTGMIVGVNKLIAPLEQKKIDNAYKKITSYSKKPDWFKIKAKNEKLLSDDVDYWNRRQDDFFETANECISRYTGSNLAACFKDLNESQERLDTALAAENARRIEAAQRDAQIKELIRQNMLLEEQNRIERSRYLYYPRYYRYPYWW